MLGQFFLSLSLLIVLHECGHFFPAKWFKTRVEKFYLFFDPYFSLFKKKIGETEYGIGWLPLGGYVKISGMVDESMDTESLKKEPQPWEFRSKKAWQRLIIMLGGVTVNFILGFLIFAGIFWYYGETYITNESLKYGIYPTEIGKKIGFEVGDKIKKVGDKDFKKANSNMVTHAITIDGVSNILVERQGKDVLLNVTPEMATEVASVAREQRLFTIPTPFIIDSILVELPQTSKGGWFSGCRKAENIASPASIAHLQKGDSIMSVNGRAIRFYEDFSEIVTQYPNDSLQFVIKRQKDTVQAIVKAVGGKIGFYPNVEDYIYVKTENQKYSFAEAVPAGFHRGITFLQDQITAFGKMFKGEIKASESVGGFKSIAKMFGVTWDWERFWLMTASLSIILAFMNLLPIPALDGGYVMFLIWEVITGKRVSDAFMEKAVTAGFFLLMTLIIVINFWDIIR